MKLLLAIAALLLVTCPAFAQQSQKQQPQPQHKSQNQAAAADHLGMTCVQILAISSSDWIAKFAAIDDSTVDAKLRGIRVYGECYDARTNQLAAALARKATGPKKAALANLNDFQAALDTFTSKALADGAPPASPLKAAYAALYAKQFRYEFYQSYEPRAQKPAPPAKKPNPAPKQNTQAPQQQPVKPSPSPVPAADSAQLPPAPAPQKEPLAGVPQKLPVPGEYDPFAPPPVPSAEPAPTRAPESAPLTKEIDPFTKAKNHFGELLGELPEERMHAVHSSFGKLFGGNPVSEDLKFEVYQYAIFLLEKPSDEPFAAPPF